MRAYLKAWLTALVILVIYCVVATARMVSKPESKAALPRVAPDPEKAHPCTRLSTSG